MDNFIEYLVKRKNSSKLIALKVLAIIGGIVVEVLLAGLLLVATSFSFFIFLAMAAAIYGLWYLLRNFNVEYEYIVTNGEMDVDKIISQAKRKRLATIDFKKMEIMAPMGGMHKREFENPSIPKTIDASISPDEKDAYFIVARTEKLGYFRLIFSPNEKIIENAKMVAPRKVFTE